jgi:hypothetical protein
MKLSQTRKSDMAKFEAGKIYHYPPAPGVARGGYVFEVVSRTATTITTRAGNVSRIKVDPVSGVEFVRPWGRGSVTVIHAT